MRIFTQITPQRYEKKTNYANKIADFRLKPAIFTFIYLSVFSESVPVWDTNSGAISETMEANEASVVPEAVT